MIAERVIKHNKTGMAGGRRIGLGIVAALATTIALTLLQSLLITTQKIPMQLINLLNYIVWIVSGTTGTIVGIGRTQQHKIAKAGIICVGYLIILVSTSLAVFSGKLEEILPGMISSMVGCLIGCIVKITIRKEKHHRWK